MLLAMVTTTAAAILRLHDAGRLEVGGPADFIVVPATADSAAGSLLQASRRDLACVAIGGRPLVAAPVYADAFTARGMNTGRICVDGVPRLVHAGLRRGIERCTIAEEGVTCH